MPYQLPPAPPVADDTPSVDERPPYGEPGRRWLVIAAVAVVVALVAVAVLVRRVWRAWRARPRREEVIVIPYSDMPRTANVYRVEFYDGTLRQLRDRDLSVALVDVHGPGADHELSRLARQWQAEVEARDSQRCFAPRVVVFDAAGRVVRSWSVAG